MAILISDKVHFRAKDNTRDNKAHLTAVAYTFFSSAHKTFTKIDRILSHEPNLNEFKRIQVI